MEFRANPHKAQNTNKTALFASRDLNHLKVALVLWRRRGNALLHGQLTSEDQRRL